MGLVRGAVRHYCLGGCSALVVCARRSRPVQGGWGRCRVSCLPRFPLPTPRFLRCVWQAVPSGWPLSSLAGTPFHAISAFHGLGPVGLLVFSACPLCVRALALSRRPRPPPPRVGVARAPRAVPVLVAGRAVPRGPCPSACPASVPCSVWLAWGGGGRPGPVPPLPGFGLCAPRGVSLRVWGVPTPGGGAHAVLPGGATRGASGVGGRLTSVRPSAFPGQATKRVSLALLWPWRAWPPYRSVSCLFAVPWHGPCWSFCGGGGSLVHRGSCGSRRLGAWRRALLRPPPPGAAGLPGAGGTLPSASGGWGAGAPVARGSVGGSGGTGGGARTVVLHLPPQPPYVAGTCSAGVVGQHRAPGAACRRRVSLAGGGGRPVCCPPRRSCREA